MRKSILLVEDNHIHRLLAQDFFEHQGYRVLGLQDGTDFFSTLSSFEPDLIVLDLSLPGVDGFTLLEQVQQSEWNNLPIIIVSSYTFERERQKAKSLGARVYFAKPVDLEVLSQAVIAELTKSDPQFLADSPIG